MRKIKFKTEYVPLSDEVINSHKNFDQLLSAYVAAPKPNWFKQFIQKKWTMFGGGLMTGAIITSLLWYNQETLFVKDTLVQESQLAPVADVLVAKLLRAQSFKVDATLAALASGDARAIERLPDALRRFLETEGLPPRTDPARLLAAQRFAQRHSIAISISLFCAALPAAFTGAKGVAVLHSTGRLRDDLDRRVNETGRFVFDVLRPGSFETGRALLAIQCVRLVHAAVRVRALRGAPAGEAAPQEIPLNQEDLLGTLACFSVVVLDAMRKMGVGVSAADAEDYVYLWRTVGAVLGIQPGLLPRDLAAAERQRDLVFQRQGRPSRDGRELATILVDGIERHLPARGASVLVPSLIHLFLGKKYIRIRRACADGDASCKAFSVYYCPDMCHEVSVVQDASTTESPVAPTEASSSGTEASAPPTEPMQ